MTEEAKRLNIQVAESEVGVKTVDHEEEELVFDKGYCWVICVCCCMLNAFTWGSNSAFAVYLSEYINDQTFEGASKLDYAAIGGIGLGLGLGCSPLINYTLGFLGLKVTICLGNICQTASLILASFSTKLWQLYLTQGLLQGIGIGLIALPNTTLIPQFFKKKRFFGSGIATAGSGLGGIIMTLAMQRIMQTKGVAWALRSQAIITCVVISIVTFLLQDRSKHHKVQFNIIDVQVLKSPAIWITFFYVMTIMFGYGICLYTLVNFTTSLGYSAHQGSIVSAMVLLGVIIGRPIVGYLCDRMGAANVTCIAYGLSCVFSFAIWVPARNYATCIVFALLTGAAMGTMYPTLAPLVAKIVGISKMNTSFGMIWVFAGAACILSPVIGLSFTKGEGGVVDPSQYTHCAIFTGCTFAAGSMAVTILRAYILARDSVVAETTADFDELELKEFFADPESLVNVKVPFAKVFQHYFDFSRSV